MSRKTPPTLLDFSEPGALEGWYSVNDSIMGGAGSTGSLNFNEALPATIFSGMLLFTHSGAGFASVRKKGRWDFSPFSHLALDLVGDGNTYTVLIKDAEAERGSYNYQATFSTQADKRQTQQLAFNRFLPRSRGQAMPEVPPLSLEEIREIGFLISSGSGGEFALQLFGLSAQAVAVGTTPATD